MLPSTTHLQQLILSALMNSDRSGREVREVMHRHGVKKSAPAFYQLMSRLERDRLVRGWYEAIEVDGHRVKERRYQILAAGVHAFNAAKSFYKEVVHAGNP